MMKLVKLQPAVLDKLWGGTKLFSWGKQTDKDNIGETWELSFYKDFPSLVASGKHAGSPLFSVAKSEDLGTSVTRFPIFPVLVKFIDSKEDLSVQVHPADAFALEHEHELGKTEMWHILEADEGAGIYLGFKKDTNEEEFRKAVANCRVMDLLNFIPVHPGEDYFIPSGTIHAIGAGVTLIEIQQNSNITYRLYDYDRPDASGKKRELHLDKGCAVLNYHKFEPTTFTKPLLGKCDYFAAYLCPVFDGEVVATPSSFKAISFVSGSGYIDEFQFSKGDTFFLPAGQSCHIKGKGEMVITEVPEK